MSTQHLAYPHTDADEDMEGRCASEPGGQAAGALGSASGSALIPLAEMNKILPISLCHAAVICFQTNTENH